MSERRLHDLLADQVDDLAPTDLVDAAWRRAGEVRRQRRVVLAAVVAVAAVAGGLGVVLAGGDRPAPPPTTPVTTPTASASRPAGPVPEAVSAGSQHGAEVWWAPDKAAEAELPRLAVAGVPEEIDLSAGAPPHPPGTRARAVFMVAGEDLADGRVVVLGEDGATYSLDVGRLEPVADEGGNAYLPLDEWSLAADGGQVLFRQDSSLEVYDLLTGEWTTVDTSDWLAEGARWSGPGEIWVPNVLGDEDGPGTVHDLSRGSLRTDQVGVYDDLWPQVGDQAYGPQALDPVGVHLSGLGPAAAQAQFPSVTLIGPRGRGVGGADAIVARDQTLAKLSVLVLSYGAGDSESPGRWKGCCPVVGWLEGPETLLFASRGADWRVLAWEVGTPRLARVARLAGWAPGEESVVAAWAALRRG